MHSLVATTYESLKGQEPYKQGLSRTDRFWGVHRGGRHNGRHAVRELQQFF